MMDDDNSVICDDLDILNENFTDDFFDLSSINRVASDKKTLEMSNGADKIKCEELAGENERNKILHAIHYDCLRVSRDVAVRIRYNDQSMEFQPDVVAQVALIVAEALITTWPYEILLFAKHARRSIVNKNDIKLLLHRNVCLLDGLEKRIEDQPLLSLKRHKSSVTRRKRQQIEAESRSNMAMPSSENLVSSLGSNSMNHSPSKLLNFWQKHQKGDLTMPFICDADQNCASVVYSPKPAEQDIIALQIDADKSSVNSSLSDDCSVQIISTGKADKRFPSSSKEDSSEVESVKKTRFEQTKLNDYDGMKADDQHTKEHYADKFFNIPKCGMTHGDTAQANTGNFPTSSIQHDTNTLQPSRIHANQSASSYFTAFHFESDEEEYNVIDANTDILQIAEHRQQLNNPVITKGTEMHDSRKYVIHRDEDDDLLLNLADEIGDLDASIFD